MTEFDIREEESRQRIATTRALVRKLLDQTAMHGVSLEERTVATAYAALDIAELHAGHGQAAVEWLRNAADVFERQLMSGAPRSADGR